MSARSPAVTQAAPAVGNGPPGAETVVQRPPAATPKPAAALVRPTGRRVGEYEVRQLLGEGGMGAVYLGWDTQLRRNVAVKVLLPRFSADREARERFLREARAAASVTHDNVVTIHHVGDHQGTAYLVMPLLKGQSLEAFLQRKGLPSLPQAVRIAREVAAGLGAAHKQGLVHRDVKPGNVWLEAPNGRVKLLDFGIAKPVASAAHTAVTDEGVVMGTPAFMSPEQARGHALDPRSDLYSLGAVLYHLCAGVPPFVRPTVMDTLTALVSEEPAPVETLNPAVPPRLAALIHQLLRRNPADRPAAGDDVIRELRLIERELAGEPGASGVVRVTLEAVPVAVPAGDGFDFEVVDDSPAEPERQHTTRRRRRVRRTPERGLSILIGLTACIAAVLVAALVIAPLVRSAGKPKEKTTPAAKPIEEPKPAAVVKPNEEAKPKPAEEQKPQPDEPDAGPPLGPDGRPRPPLLGPDGRPMPPPPHPRFPPPRRERP